MTIDNLCFYLQNRLIQTNQTGGQRYSPPLVFPGIGHRFKLSIPTDGQTNQACHSFQVHCGQDTDQGYGRRRRRRSVDNNGTDDQGPIL